MATEDDLDIFGLAPLYYYRSSDAQPGPTKPKPLPTWHDSLPVVDFDGSAEALERGQIEKPPPTEASGDL